MRRLWLPLLGWLLVAGFAWTVARRPPPALEEEGPGTHEVHHALGPGQEIAFPLGAAEARVRILAHLETPDPGVADETRSWRYGLAVAVEPSGGGEPRTREHWMVSRRTLLEDGLPALVTTRPGAVLTDSRILELEPATLVPSGGLLRIRPLLEREGQRILVRAWRERPASPPERLRILQRPALRDARMGRAWPWPWEALSSVERRTLSGAVREPIAPMETRAATASIFRIAPPSPAPSVPEEGIRLEPGQATALNLVGPCVLHVGVERDDGSGEPARGVPLETRLVDASARPVRDPVLEPYRVTVPAGAIWSLRWTAPWEQEAVRLAFTTTPDDAWAWGEPPGAAGEQPVAPETRRFAVFRLDLGLSPIVVPAATGGAWGSLLVEARPLPAGDWSREPGLEGTGTPVTVSWTARDESGRPVGWGSFTAGWVYTPFERYVDDIAPWMSEETRVHLHHPADATTLSFEADGPVDLRFLAPVDAEPTRTPPYDLPARWMARHAPWDVAPTVTLQPLGLPALLQENRVVRFDAVVRIEPQRTSAAGLSRVATRSVEPEGAPPRHFVAERASGGPWEPWHRTRLGPDFTLEVPADGRLAVDWRVPPEAVGDELRIACGGVHARAPLTAAAGIARLDGLPSGRQSCALDAPDGEYLAHAPGSGERWARRGAWRADGRSLEVAVDLPEGGPGWVFVRPYTLPGHPPPRLTVRVDDGEPRVTGRPSVERTRASRTLVPDRSGRSARLEDLAPGDAVAWEAVAVGLADDLAPGRHRVSVEVESEGPAWVRFDATEAPIPPEEPEHWAREVPCDRR